ncbi:MAG: T9SS type A sorting domain-containing protein [Hymenobacter sp.]|nr:MAG: T9SS type A sorting domain-containing protein [Hymenobacter sp.]
MVQLAAGRYHSLALAADGTVYAWGLNTYGALGNNSTTNSTTPVAVSLPVGVHIVQVAAGAYHGLALADDGTVYAWGDNYYGALGNNSTTQSTTPVAVTMPAGVRFVQLAAENRHGLALAADGRLFTWGYNNSGQLGTGTITDSLVPVAEASGTVAWTGPAAGPVANHSLVLGPGAAVYSAGLNQYGQLGDGTTTNSPLFMRNLAPLPVQLVSFTAQAAGPAAVRLAWATASEVHSAYFAIERSLDGTTWQELGRVAAAGSSASPRQYAYPDQAAPAGVLYYRLRQVDQDGTAAYSPVQTLTLGAGGLALYPNPARGGAATFSGIAPGAAVRVLDALGRVTATATADATGTAHLTGLAPGLYVVQAGASSLHLAVE